MIGDFLKNKGNNIKSADIEVPDVVESGEELYDEDEIDDELYSDYGNSDDSEADGNNDQYSSESSLYDEIDDSEEQSVKVDDNLRTVLDGIAKSGNSIVVTGASGCGVSTVAMNTAVTISKLGYRVLVVDLDTEQRAQGYISLRNFDATGLTNMGLEKAINDMLPIGNIASFVRKNMYLLTLGISIDAYKLNETIKVENISKFMGSTRAMFDFVVYDVPIRNIIDYSADIALLSDKLLLVTDTSTWGIMKTIGVLLNIEDENLIRTFFNKSYMVFNRVSGNETLMGEKFKVNKKWCNTFDSIVTQLTGEDIGIYFKDMMGYMEIGYSDEVDLSWYQKKAYADTKIGGDTFMKLVSSLFIG